MEHLGLQKPSRRCRCPESLIKVGKKVQVWSVAFNPMPASMNIFYSRPEDDRAFMHTIYLGCSSRNRYKPLAALFLCAWRGRS